MVDAQGRSSMTTLATRSGPNGRTRPSLGDQLDRLDGILNGLADALNQSVTAAVSAAVGKAVREAVEAVTRDLASRAVPTSAVIPHPESTGGRPLRRHLIAQWCKSTQQIFAPARRAADSLFDHLRASIVDAMRRTMRAPRRFAAVVLVGIAAGATAGVSGPLMGAVLGGLAGFVAALTATPEG
jgi:hypothetical protein